MIKDKKQIPEGWRKVKFGDYINLLYGSNLPKEKREYGLYPVYGSNGITDYHNGYLVEGPGIVIGRKGSIGLIQWSDENFWPIDTTYYIGLKEKTNLRWIYYKLQTLGLNKMNSASGVPGLNRNEVYNLDIGIPPLNEQIKIATILSKVDEEIGKVDAIIESAEKLKIGLMRKLLIKGIGHTKFKKTEIGEIPEDWGIKKLGKVCKFENGKAHEKQISENGNYIVVNSKFISTDGEVVKHSNDNLKPLSIGDIVMVMSDVPNGKALGKCFLIQENNKYTLNQRICSLRPYEGNSKFYFYVLNRNNYFVNFDNGVGQTNLRKEEVLACTVQVPSIREQEQIVKILKETDEYISVNRKSKIHLEQLKKGLMTDLLSGKVRTI